MQSDDRLGEITVLLRKWGTGDEGAIDKLFPLVYEELRGLARSAMARERGGHTFSSTELVHEAYLRLAGASSLEVKDRSHFFTLAARTMRRILVDHARAQVAAKRVGHHLRQPLIEAIDVAEETPSPETIVAIDGLLDRLKQIRPRAGELVELRFFGGLSETEAAEVLEVSRSSMARDWRYARVWLLAQFSQA